MKVIINEKQLQEERVNYWVREETLAAVEEEEEEFLWLCIQTLKTCLLTPTLRQNLSISSSRSLLWSFQPSFSANPSIFSFWSSVNLDLNRFLLLLPPYSVGGLSAAARYFTFRWKLRWHPHAAHCSPPAPSTVYSPHPSVA